ncbi:NAD(+) synthase [Halosimplex sp. J119]
MSLPRDDRGLATTADATRRLEELLPEFLRSFVSDAGADCLVVPLDGSVDTSLSAALAVDALDPDRVRGLVMPAQLSDEAGARDAEAVASTLDIDFQRLHLQPVLAAFQKVIGTDGKPTDDLHAVENALDRIRMASAYYVSNLSNGLVVGTLNRTDRLVGTPTKFGDTGVDCHLLGDLYRTEVGALARRVGVPENIRTKTSYREVRDGGPTDRFSLDTETLDRVLRFRVDERRPAKTVADRLDVDVSTVERIADWCSETRHKRHQPPKPSTHI